MASEDTCALQSREKYYFQNKTLLVAVMLYRHNKTFWYQFCNFKHFLKAENSEDNLASSCEEFCINWLSCNLLLELSKTQFRPSHFFKVQFLFHIWMCVQTWDRQKLYLKMLNMIKVNVWGLFFNSPRLLRGSPLRSAPQSPLQSVWAFMYMVMFFMLGTQIRWICYICEENFNIDCW